MDDSGPVARTSNIELVSEEFKLRSVYNTNATKLNMCGSFNEPVESIGKGRAVKRWRRNLVKLTQIKIRVSEGTTSYRKNQKF